jgi:asparaginyl-tRNA synthetase
MLPSGMVTITEKFMNIYLPLHIGSILKLQTSNYKAFMSESKRIKIVDLLKTPEKTGIGNTVTIKGWVRTKRGNKNVAFIALNDGSIIHSIQVVVDLANFNEELLKQINTGACISVTGTLVESPGAGQSVEMHATEIEVYGSADPDTYPLQKKGHTLEFLREIAHLRPRTNTFGAVLRIRHNMAFAIHKYFNDKGFYYIHTPIITGSDAEGAGAMFKVTTLDLNNLPKNETGDIDYSQDFFGKSTNLTVSGQLNGELAAMALSEIYTFGPTFRAENSNTPRHLAEFWMIEPEMAFYDIVDNMDLAEDFLKYLIRYAIENCYDDLEFLQKMYDNELLERLNFVVNNDFERLSYTRAIEILLASGQKFEFPVEWGVDLQSEHERYLVEKVFMKPVILTDYPKEIKAFYMKQNEDGKTVRAMDVLFPRIGEIIGGSQREENYDKLIARIHELHIPEKDMWWYLETRKFGTAPHAGFGLGFERLMLFVTGMLNIRDVIPFPRTPMTADF